MLKGKMAFVHNSMWKVLIALGLLNGYSYYFCVSTKIEQNIL